MTWTLQGLWPHVSPISPASLHPRETGQITILGCSTLPFVQPFAHAVLCGWDTLPPLPHLVGIYCPSYLSLGIPSSKKPALILHVGHLWAPTVPCYPHCIINTLGGDLIYPSISPLDSEPMGVWNVSHSPLSLTVQGSAGPCHAYRVQ